eukprot:7307488-Prymnesium_polylepis.1
MLNSLKLLRTGGEASTSAAASAEQRSRGRTPTRRHGRDGCGSIGVARQGTGLEGASSGQPLKGGERESCLVTLVGNVFARQLETGYDDRRGYLAVRRSSRIPPLRAEDALHVEIYVDQVQEHDPTLMLERALNGA